MARTNFFANTTINFENIDFPTVYYPSPQADVKDTFDVPKHNINTPNLLVFLDGSLVQRGLVYDDITSTQIKFKNPVRVNQEVFAILLVQKEGGNNNSGGGGGQPQTIKEELKWQGSSQHEANLIVNTAANIPANPTYDGQLFFTTDTGDQYLALPNNTKLKITDLIFTSALPVQGLENKLYLTPTALAFWNKDTANWNLFQKTTTSNPQQPTEIKSAPAITTRINGSTPFTVGSIVGWNPTLNRYDHVSDTIEPIGIISEKTGTTFDIVHFGNSNIVNGSGEGKKLYYKNNTISTDDTGIPIGRVVNGKVFIELKDKVAINPNQPQTKFKRNVVIMLGNNLTPGEHTEVQVVFPYRGTLKNIYSNRDNSSVGIFSYVLKYGDPTPLQNIAQIDFSASEKRKTTAANLQINSAVFLIDILSCNHQTVGLNIVLEIETEE